MRSINKHFFRHKLYIQVDIETISILELISFLLYPIRANIFVLRPSITEPGVTTLIEV